MKKISFMEKLFFLDGARHVRAVCVFVARGEHRHWHRKVSISQNVQDASLKDVLLFKSVLLIALTGSAPVFQCRAGSGDWEHNIVDLMISQLTYNKFPGNRAGPLVVSGMLMNGSHCSDLQCLCTKRWCTRLKHSDLCRSHLVPSRSNPPGLVG